MNTKSKIKRNNIITDILNNFSIYYQEIQTLKQNKIKILKITLFNIFNLCKTTYLNILLTGPKLVYYFFIFLIKNLIKSFSILFLAPKIIKKQVYNKFAEVIFSLYLYHLKTLLNKRDTLLRLSTKSIKRYRKKKIFKNKILNYFIQRGIIRYKFGMRYFMRKVRRKKKFDVKLRKRSTIFTKYLKNYFSFEDAFYKTESKLTYNVLNSLSKIEYVLENLTKIINYFKTYKKLTIFRALSNLILDKFRNIMVSINNRSVLLNLFRKFDQTIQNLLIKRLFIHIYKRSKKRFIKNDFNLLIARIFIFVYFLFKIILIFNIIFNQKMVHFVSGRLELLFSIQSVVNEYSPYFNKIN